LKVWYLARREFTLAFRTPLGYILAAVYALISGGVFIAFMERFRQASLRFQQSPFMIEDLAVPVTPEVWLVEPYISNISSILIFFVPFLTMGSIAGERRSGSLELLLSYPISTGQIVFGKFLGTFLIFASLVAVNLLHILVFSIFRSTGMGAVVTGLLGLLLMGTATLAFGIMISALSQGPLEAAILTLGLLAGLVLAGGSEGGEGWRQVAHFLSPAAHMKDLARGVLRLEPVLAYAAGCVTCLALALRGVDWLRWRGTGA
jgi:ABC-2 type transport system permease protein